MQSVQNVANCGAIFEKRRSKITKKTQQNRGGTEKHKKNQNICSAANGKSTK